MADPLRRQRSGEAIAAVIRQLIQSKQLPPGQMLESVVAMRKRFRASQYAVLRAMEMLVREGFVVSRPRSGYYVAETIQPASVQAAWTAPTRRDPSLDLLPAAASRALTVYTCDGYPPTVAYWRSALDTFASQHRCSIRLLSQEHGRIEELLGSEAIDLIFHSTTVLESLPAGTLLEASGDTAEWELSDPVPPVAALLAAKRLPGLPFALSVLTLYRRCDQLAKAGVDTGAFTGLEDFLQRMAAVERNLPGKRGCPSWTCELPLYLGGVLFEGADGRTRLDQDRAAEVLRLLSGSPLLASGLGLHGGDIPGFLGGSSCGLAHQSFLSIEAMAIPEVARQPLASAERPSWAYLMALAVTAASRQRGLALELLRWLGSVENQSGYAKLGGHLPASLRACAAVPGERGAFLTQAMHSCALTTSQSSGNSFVIEAMPVILRCLRGGLDPQQGASALAQIMKDLGGEVLVGSRQPT